MTHHCVRIIKCSRFSLAHYHIIQPLYINLLPAFLTCWNLWNYFGVNDNSVITVGQTLCKFVHTFLPHIKTFLISIFVIAIWQLHSISKRLGQLLHITNYVSVCLFTLKKYIKHQIMNIYIIIKHCPGVGAFPRPFCVPNSVALASLTLQVGDWAIH